jgi:hypothetical protein
VLSIQLCILLQEPCDYHTDDPRPATPRNSRVQDTVLHLGGVSGKRPRGVRTVPQIWVGDRTWTEFSVFLRCFATKGKAAPRTDEYFEFAAAPYLFGCRPSRIGEVAPPSEAANCSVNAWKDHPWEDALASGGPTAPTRQRYGSSSHHPSVPRAGDCQVPSPTRCPTIAPARVPSRPIPSGLDPFASATPCQTQRRTQPVC